MLRVPGTRILRTLPAVVFAAAAALPVWALPGPTMTCCPMGGMMACCPMPDHCVLSNCDGSDRMPVPVALCVFVVPAAEAAVLPADWVRLAVASVSAYQILRPDLPDPPPRG